MAKMAKYVLDHTEERSEAQSDLEELKDIPADELDDSQAQGGDSRYADEDRIPQQSTTPPIPAVDPFQVITSFLTK